MSSTNDLPVGHDVLADEYNGGVIQPHAWLRATVDQSVANNTFTAVNLDTEDSDTHNGHSTVTNTGRYTAQIAGWYRILGRTGWASNATGWRALDIYHGPGAGDTAVLGCADWKPCASSTFAFSLQAMCDLHMAVNDYVYMAAFQTSGGALNLFSGADIQCSMSVQLIRRD
jgi:hypothetical protein